MPSLRIFQANVDKAPEPHQTALQLAYTEDYNIVLLQEPHTPFNEKKNTFQIPEHPGFYCFSPVSSWNSTDTRPRVLTYIRRVKNLNADQLFFSSHRDLLWVRVNGVTILNVYNDPLVPETLQILKGWKPEENSIIAGDMNASHPLWRTDRPMNRRGRVIAAWVEKHDLRLLNEPDIDTTFAKGDHRPNTIDLAFSNIANAEATIEEHLTVGSLHHTISVEALSVEAAPRIPSRYHITSPEELRRFADHVAQAAESISMNLPDHAAIESATAALSELLDNALKACGRRKTGRRARQSPWWNEECTAARDDFRIIWRATESATGEETQRAKVYFRRTVRRVQRDFWRDIIARITEPDDVYRITRWLKPRQRLSPPPIQVNNEVFSTNISKARALGQSKLARRDNSDDISDPWIPLTDTVQEIPLQDTIRHEETREALLSTGNTTPGIDGITTKMLQVIWPSIGQLITRIYGACLKQGYYPTAFKTAEVAMIPKLNKRDLRKPAAWRPISLLSCLGKGLERLIAKRLSVLAVKYKVLHPNQAGALPNRSATDIVTALLFDVEKALGKGLVATLVTMDVEGAFDAILRNRLILRLRKQGWPLFLIQFIASFLASRYASVRFQDAIAEPIELLCGIPQGSPISPILYLLATAPIYQLEHAEERYGYADDTAMLFIGKTLEETTARANKAIAEMETWGQSEAVAFDSEKTEVMHFSRKRNPTSPTIQHQGKNITADAAMRWLGVWLDRKLTFRIHIDKWIHRAKRVIAHLQSINNTIRGVSAAAARRALWAVVIPTLFYGIDVWYPGHMTTKYLAGITKKIQLVLNEACRMILPVWSTCPLTVLWKEAGVPPAKVLLKHLGERIANRWATLDATHPITRRIAQAKHEANYPDNNKPEQARATAQKRCRLLRNAAIALEQQRPRLIPKRYSQAIQIEGPQQRPSKEDACQKLQEWLDSRPPGFIVFSDGSKTERDTAGYGFAVFHRNRLVDWGKAQLGRQEVFDAEIQGALAGLTAAIALNSAAEPITICIDNTAVIDSIGGTAARSSQMAFRTLQKTGDENPGLISLRWCPGHVGIFGNELADQLAKDGALLPVQDQLPSVSYCKRRVKGLLQTFFAEWWQGVDRPSYRQLQLKADTKALPELRLQRRQLGYLLATRSHHGDFADYHERFNHQDADVYCACSRRKSPTHLFYCRMIPRRLRPQLGPNPAAAIGRFLGRSFKVYVKLADFYYQKVNKQY